MCVQRFDDSLNSAIHITYRNSLRSSSMREPRDPLLKVVFLFIMTHSKTKDVCIRHRQGKYEHCPYDPQVYGSAQVNGD